MYNILVLNLSLVRKLVVVPCSSVSFSLNLHPSQAKPMDPSTAKLFTFFGVLILALSGSGASLKCGFSAIYNFGDSNSDTGAISASALYEIPLPNGETFFKFPSGRVCDGRLLIDFIAENLQLPYLSPYLDSVEPNFRHGANFATGGSSIRPGGYSPFHLGVQIAQFLRFKSRTIDFYNKLSRTDKIQPYRSYLPLPEEFSKALYTFDIGQNDLSYGFQHSTLQQLVASIPDILWHFSRAVRVLYNEGARFFWIHNTGPIGCLPVTAVPLRARPEGLDRMGCVKSRNGVAQEFNRQLKEMVSRLRTQLPLASFTYTDVYSIKHELIREAQNLGFVDPLSVCCGSSYEFHICGQKAQNGTVFASPCEHPMKHVSWDGIHYSEAANQWVVNRILNGSFSDPPVSILEACQ